MHANAVARQLRTIDATCPLVTKVHVEARKFAADGYTIVLVGHDGHEEVEGTMGEAPDHIVLVQTEEDVDALELPDPEQVAYISQTTLSVDETRGIIERLRERFPTIVGPRTDDICYATTNRQAAVRKLATRCDLVLVIGSRNSSNSQRLVEVARDCGARAHLIDNAAELDEDWLEGVRTVGITSGASAPEMLVQELVELIPRARRRGHLGARRSRARTSASCCRRRFAPRRPPRRHLSRTLVVSDLHLGTRAGATWLRRDGVLDALLDALDGVDRLVLLGDTLELRQGRASRRARARAPRPRARSASGWPVARWCSCPATTITRWSAAGSAHARRRVSGSSERCAPARASFARRAVASLLAPAQVEVAYPGSG